MTKKQLLQAVFFIEKIEPHTLVISKKVLYNGDKWWLVVESRGNVADFDIDGPENAMGGEMRCS